MRKFLKWNSKGLSLVELLIALGLLSVVGLGGITAVNQMLKVKAQTQAGESILRFRGRLIELINSSASWRETLQNTNNTSLSCLQNLTDCTSYSSGWTDITIVNAQREVLVDSSNVTAGLSNSGEVCSDFSTSGNPQCPFRYRIQWRALCGPTTCVNPQVQIKGVLSVASGSSAGTVINLGRYSINMIRGQLTNTLEDACLSAQGVFEPISKTCRLPMEGLCPTDNQVVLGVDPKTMQKRCGYLFVGSCPAVDISGTPMVFYGADASGDPVCYPQIASTCWTCTPGSPGCPDFPAGIPVGGGGDGGGGGTDGGCDGSADGGGGTDGGCDGSADGGAGTGS